jgi:hypothetical protein
MVRHIEAMKLGSRNLILFALLLLPRAVFAQEPDHDLLDFMAGTYHVVGKSYESDQTYLGEVKMLVQKNQLKIIRMINGKKVTGTGHIEGSEMTASKILRIRFIQEGISYEETCLFQGDLDNYARITCYLYRPGIKTEASGLEALFISRKK